MTPTTAKVQDQAHAHRQAILLKNPSEDQIINLYLPVVKELAQKQKRKCPDHVRTDELYSAGLTGLLEAVRRFEPEQAKTFEGYVRIRVHGAIVDEMRKNSQIPRRFIKFHRDLISVRNRLETAFMREATNEELAEEMNLSPAEFHKMVKKAMPAVIIHLDKENETSDQRQGKNAHDTVADETPEIEKEQREKEELLGYVFSFIEEMPERTRYIMKRYYEDGVKIYQIGHELMLTESRISQILQETVAVLRKKIQIKKLV